MAIHHEVLNAALGVCRGRKGWRFRPAEIVRSLPHLNAGTVNTHIVSRCCVDAPANHPHRWDYFVRVARGVYEIRRPYRRRVPAPIHGGASASRGSGRSRRSVSERAAAYGPSRDTVPRDTIHVLVSRSARWYVAECHEIAVITQGRTLDDLVANLQDAVDLHLDGEDPAVLGLVNSPRLSLIYDLPPRSR